MQVMRLESGGTVRARNDSDERLQWLARKEDGEVREHLTRTMELALVDLPRSSQRGRHDGGEALPAAHLIDAVVRGIAVIERLDGALMELGDELLDGRRERAVRHVPRPPRTPPGTGRTPRGGAGSMRRRAPRPPPLPLAAAPRGSPPLARAAPLPALLTPQLARVPLPRLSAAATSQKTLGFGWSVRLSLREAVGQEDSCEGRVVMSFHLFALICFIFLNLKT
jgi:hypothetical protein